MFRRNLSLPEMSLLSNRLKFLPSAYKIDWLKLKRELEEYGRKLSLMWHFRNYDRDVTNSDLSLLLIQGIKIIP